MTRKFTVLAFATVISVTAFAQSTRFVPAVNLPKVPASIANKAIPLQLNQLPGAEKLSPNSQQQNTPSLQKNVSGTHAASQKIRDVSDQVIGHTYYDVQTNASVRNALVRNLDGTMSSVWTMGPTDAQGSWPDRGVGYNYYNGTDWSSPPDTTAVPPRSGWPNVVNLANGKEFVVDHNTTVSQLELNSRDTKGTGAWTSSTATLPSPISQGNWWPRMIRGGADENSIHVISITYPTGNGGVIYHGMDGALLYSRSTDGGATWDKVNVQLPWIDSSTYTGVTGDNYAMDTKGDEIAIVVGGFTSDVTLLKSNDNGDTWTSTPIYQFPIHLYQNGDVTDITGDGVADTLETNDGALSVLIDNNDKVHVWFGNMRVINDGSFATIAYFPGTNGLVYWDESMENGDPLPVIAGAPDLDQDGILNIAVLGKYNQGLSSWASSGIDEGGYLYVSYGACLETTNDNPNIDADGKNLRHTYVMISKDNGLTWDYDHAVDVITDPFAEGIWASMAKNVDSKVRLVYQRDYCSGDAVPASDGSVADPCNIGEQNDIVYVDMDVSDLVGISPVNATTSDLSLYPNPSNGFFTLNSSSINTSTVDLQVLNSLGQVVKQLTDQAVVAGKVNVNVSGIPAGLYLLNVKSASGNSSIPFSITK